MLEKCGFFTKGELIMKSTSSIKMLILSLTFAAVHFVASPMQWIVQPERRSSEDKQQAVSVLKTSINAYLAEVRSAKAGWFSSKPVESVDAFFAKNPGADVLSALLDADEYEHAINSLNQFLVRDNNDHTKRNAYKTALDFALNGSFSMIVALTQYHMKCINANKDLMDQTFMDNTVALMLMGYVAMQQLDSAGKDLSQYLIKTMSFFKNSVLTAQLKGLLGKSSVQNDQETNEYLRSEYFQARCADVIEIINENKGLWVQVSNVDQAIEHLSAAQSWQEFFDKI